MNIESEIKRINTAYMRANGIDMANPDNIDADWSAKCDEADIQQAIIDEKVANMLKHECWISESISENPEIFARIYMKGGADMAETMKATIESYLEKVISNED